LHLDKSTEQIPAPRHIHHSRKSAFLQLRRLRSSEPVLPPITGGLHCGFCAGGKAEDARQHRRVDAGGGAVPLPSVGEVKAARSVELSSERLGIIAQLDLLEGEDGGVVPVDTKKGRPARDGGPWEADAVQVCAQVLLLREHGYTAEHGEIFYAETRQRIRVAITPSL
jgi:hypothetical protein